MKKITLLGINSRFSHPNLALYCLRNYISDLELTIDIKEFTVTQDTGEIIEALVRERPDIIGFSVYIWNAGRMRELLLKIRERLDDCTIILGGPEVSYDPGEWIVRYASVDFIITGCGEEGLRGLLLRGCRDGNKIIEGRNPHFSKLPFPYRESDFQKLKNRNIYYEASRGCPYRCSYCVSSRKDQMLEFRDLETVREELRIIARHRPKIVKFLDRTFNAKKSFYKPVWKHLADEYGDSKIRFHFEIFPALLDEEDFLFLEQCPYGLFQFEVGVQSVNRETLAAIERPGDWEAIKPLLRRLVGMGNIPVHADLVAGLPYEDITSMRRSFDEIYGLKCGHFQLGMLKILKGTRLFDEVGRYGIVFSDTAPYMIRRNIWLSEGEVDKLFIISQLVDTLYNTHTFETTLEGLEKFYGSYFVLYDTFAGFLTEHHSGPGSRSKVWEVNAGRILNFIRLFHGDEEEYFRDLLRWDWAVNSRHNYCPDFLRHEDNKRVKKSAIKFFLQYSDGKTILFQGTEFPEADLKRSIYYKAGTEKFMKEKMNNNAMALFLPGKNKILFSL